MSPSRDIHGIAIRDAEERDSAAIAQIYNHAVIHTTAVFSDAQVDASNRALWRADRVAQGFPVLVAEREGAVRGYASFGGFRSFPGYCLTVEHSVYVDPAAQGAGIGRALLAAVIDRARSEGVHVMVAGIEAGNAASIRLHRQLGFEEVGLMPEVGQKFGRWLDLCLMQLRLDDRPGPSG